MGTLKDGKDGSKEIAPDGGFEVFNDKLGYENSIMGLGFRELGVNPDLISRYVFDADKTFYAVTFSGPSPDEGHQLFADNREYWSDLVNQGLIDSVFAVGDQITVVLAVGQRAEAENIIERSPLAKDGRIKRTPLREVVL
jgi:hypothetical protein